MFDIAPSGDGLPRVIVVLGPWSSGSTAVTGFLARTGGWTCPPHQMTNDPLTPDSHESKAFRDALCHCIDELTLEPRAPIDQFTYFFRPWIAQQRQQAAAAGQSAVVLKHPLAAFALPQILACCEPSFLVILRPLPEIEASRVRRRWHPVYGQSGAQKIYSAAFSGLIRLGRSFQAISYPQFVAHPDARKQLLHSLGLAPDSAALAQADAWVRGAKSTTSDKSQVI